VGDGGKQWGNSTIKCELLLLDKKIKYPKHMHCLEYYNDGDYDEDDNDDMILFTANGFPSGGSGDDNMTKITHAHV
jgi:hypothetical protein